MKKFRKSFRAILYTLIFGLFFNAIALSNGISGEKHKRAEQRDELNEKPEWFYATMLSEQEMLKQFISKILIDAMQDEAGYLFSDNLMNFFEKVLMDQKEFEPKKTEQALQELLSYLLVKVETSKALRPDAPHFTDGSPVGDLETFSAAQIIQLINALIQHVNNCCGQIQINFTGTFTVLNTLIQDFNGTFTELNHIENTLLADFNGIFTALFACCQADFQDFNGIFTTLNELTTTITADFNSIFTVLDSCCNGLVQDFNGVFTALNEFNTTLTVDFNGIFTVINEFCTTNSVEFSGIFTAINELNNTITLDFNSIFTVLNACCTGLEFDLNGAYTVLNDIKNTLTTDFNGTFTILANLSEDVNSVFTVLTTVSEIIDTDFNGVFTSLAILCQENALNFSGIFTTVNEISQIVVTDFQGSFTAINACCTNLNTDFSGVFTTLSDIKNTLTSEFNGTFTALSSLISDIENTFTVLANIDATLSADFNGVFTTLNTCCQSIAVDFNGLFTLLSAINETLTTDFNGIFTALNTCCQETQVSFNGIFTTLTEIETTLTTDFNGTFTVIAHLNNASPCSATPITAPTTISSPGYYCLANDIFGTLIITVSNVSVNLNNHTITAVGQPGISITNAPSNVDVFNGKIDSSAIGVEVLNTSTVNLSNLIISNCSDSGIVLNQFCTTIAIQDCIINTVANFGIHFININDVSSCRRVTLINCNGQFGIGTSGSLSTALFEDCSVVNCNSTQAQFIPFNLASGISNSLVRCSVKNIQNSVGSIIAFNIGSNATILNGCKVQGLSANTTANGYLINNNGVLIQNSLAIGINGSESFGFNLTGTSAIMESCLTQQISSPLVGDAFGFSVTDAGLSLADCYAFQTTGTGVALLLLSPGSVTTDSMLFNCGANNNSGNGFGYISFPFTYVANCTAFNNNLVGFEAQFVGAGQYGCFASANAGGNYSVSVPNVQPASQNAGVFARGNNFI